MCRERPRYRCMGHLLSDVNALEVHSRGAESIALHSHTLA
jgi:hypothetical protein